MDRKLLMGIGLGMVAGGALSMAAMPRRRSEAKRMVDRAKRTMGGVIDDMTSVMGR